MNLGEAKKKALSLMAEYSTDGVLIPDGENADYLLRMNRFASDAQMEISEKVGINTSYTFTQIGSSADGYNKYPVTADFKEHRYIELNGKDFTNYRLRNKELLIPKSYDGTFEWFYYKNPTELTPNTPDTYEFEVDKNVQYLIPYFMGGMAIQDENVLLADRLLNMYYGRLAEISKKSEDYQQTIKNTYSIF